MGTVSTINISLPDSLKAFVDEQVRQHGYSTRCQYIRQLIGKDQQAQSLKALLHEGAQSPPAGAVDGAYFEGLRKKARAGK